MNGYVFKGSNSAIFILPPFSSVYLFVSWKQFIAFKTGPCIRRTLWTEDSEANRNILNLQSLQNVEKKNLSFRRRWFVVLGLFETVFQSVSG